jgi:hypothetical protein
MAVIFTLFYEEFEGLLQTQSNSKQPSLFSNVGRRPGQFEGEGPKILQFAHLRRH